MYQKSYYVYILARKHRGTIYVGVTSNLIKRIYEHKTGSCKGFTSKYGVNCLVYFEEYGDVRIAIQREKRLKEWPRKWKLDLIEKNNPGWQDLYEKII